jgi:hypothetical protein
MSSALCRLLGFCAGRVFGRLPRRRASVYGPDIPDGASSEKQASGFETPIRATGAIRYGAVGMILRAEPSGRAFSPSCITMDWIATRACLKPAR